MKRFVIAAVAALGLATAGLAYGDPVGGVQPACADLGGGGFSLTGGEVRGSLNISNGVLSCPSVTYTLYVIFQTPGGTTVTRSDSVKGTGTSDIVSGFSVRVPPFVTTVETYAESSNSSGVLDRGPDSGTIPVAEGSGGGSGYN
jgi:hypothetical protein